MHSKKRDLSVAGETIKEVFLKRKYDIVLLMLAACFPIYRYSVSGVMLPVLCLVFIYQYFRSSVPFDKTIFVTQLRYFFITAGFFLVMIFSLLYSSNIHAGLRTLQYGAYILVYPLIIIFFVKEISNREINLILFCFVFSSFVYLAFINYWFFEAGLYTEFRPAEFNKLPFRDVLMTLKIGKGHPTYVSMFFFFSALFLIHFLLNNKVTFWIRVTFIVAIGMFIFSSVILSVKITVIAFFFSLLLLIHLQIRNKRLVVLIFVMVTLLFTVALFKVSFLRARFIDEFQATELKPPIGLNTNSLNIRVGIFECSKTVFKNNWLIGTGVGDFQDELNKCYLRFETNVYQESKYDSHNNYFEIAISTGIVGLTLFLYMLTFHIIESVKFKNSIFLSFLLFVIICMVPENILSRNHGIIFFSLLGSLFIKQNLSNRIAK